MKEEHQNLLEKLINSRKVLHCQFSHKIMKNPSCNLQLKRLNLDLIKKEQKIY